MSHSHYDEARVRRSFANQPFMATIGAVLTAVAPGEVEIEMPTAHGVRQQHGFVHGGVVGSLADSACGFAALSVAAPDSGVLTTEFKCNFLAPSVGEKLIARGSIIKAGRTLTLTEARIYGVAEGKERLCAHMTATIMTVQGRAGIAD
ncbi:MAG: PaaI family thioesterase [Beijerinckiaceae bacterium]|nr:PaaI family thioesterase [Beijerinckiaceae bacterium]